MERPDWKPLLERTTVDALRWLEGLPDARVRPDASTYDVLDEVDGPLPVTGTAPDEVVADLVRAVEPGLTAMPGGRFFGWVIGGALPSSLAADWLVATWDQNAGMTELSPGTVAVEQVAARWVVEALRLPERTSVGFVTGGQMANLTCLAAARNSVLGAYGWDVEASGLIGSPPIRVLVGRDVHSTVPRALRVLGLGGATAVQVDTDDQGRMRPDALASALAGWDGPAIVCLGAGNVTTGAFDPFVRIATVIEEHLEATGGPPRGIWSHVDGAFGMWAAASRGHRHLTAGVERADSWATDAHKWLNTPYDCGIAMTRHPVAHQAAMGVRADYVPLGDDEALREPLDWNPEFSRRARGVPVYAALRELGRDGIEAMVERCCAHAERFADLLRVEPGVSVVNDVVLNQVVVRFSDPAGADDDEHTSAVLDRVRADGTCFMSGATWRGEKVMRISVSNWSTDTHDVDRSAAAIVRAHRATAP